MTSKFTLDPTFKRELQQAANAHMIRVGEKIGQIATVKATQHYKRPVKILSETELRGSDVIVHVGYAQRQAKWGYAFYETGNQYYQPQPILRSILKNISNQL